MRHMFSIVLGVPKNIREVVLRAQPRPQARNSVRDIVARVHPNGRRASRREDVELSGQDEYRALLEDMSLMELP